MPGQWCPEVPGGAQRCLLSAEGSDTAAQPRLLRARGSLWALGPGQWDQPRAWGCAGHEPLLLLLLDTTELYVRDWAFPALLNRNNHPKQAPGLLLAVRLFSLEKVPVPEGTPRELKRTFYTRGNGSRLLD